jgi:undecaprenyl diphosphate synthase
VAGGLRRGEADLRPARLGQGWRIPRHVAFIMDGNGRWAQQRGQPRHVGHKAGYERIREVLEVCGELGVEVVSCFAWSTENWARPQAEVEYILHAVERELPRFAEELDQRHVRFVHSGSLRGLPPGVRRALEQAILRTRMNGPRVFNLVFNYGGRAEIVEAARRILRDQTTENPLTEADVRERLWTAGLPDVDLLVRTGGEWRISNFLLWQSAFAVLYILDAYWPAIEREDILRAVDHYRRVYVGRDPVSDGLRANISS